MLSATLSIDALLKEPVETGSFLFSIQCTAFNGEFAAARPGAPATSRPGGRISGDGEAAARRFHQSISSMGTVVLNAKPKGIFSSTYILSEENREAARLTMKAMREAGTLTIGERTYTMTREKLFSGDFTLKDDLETVIVRASKPSAMKALFNLTYGDLRFELSRVSVWKSGFALWWNGEKVGSIERRRWFARDAELTLPESMPLEVRAFIFWLVVIQWNRDAAASG